MTLKIGSAMSSSSPSSSSSSPLWMCPEAMVRFTAKRGRTLRVVILTSLFWLVLNLAAISTLQNRHAADPRGGLDTATMGNFLNYGDVDGGGGVGGGVEGGGPRVRLQKDWLDVLELNPLLYFYSIAPCVLLVFFLAPFARQARISIVSPFGGRGPSQRRRAGRRRWRRGTLLRGRSAT